MLLGPGTANDRAQDLVALRAKGAPHRIPLLDFMPKVRGRGNRQHPADGLDPAGFSMLVDERHYHFARRSSSTCAKTRTPSEESRLRASVRSSRVRAASVAGARPSSSQAGGRHHAPPAAPIAAAPHSRSRSSRPPTGSLRRILAGVLKHQPDRAHVTRGSICWVVPWAPILSRNEPSDKPGTVQTVPMRGTSGGRHRRELGNAGPVDPQ